MKNKKIFSILTFILALIMSFSMFACQMPGAGGGGNNNDNTGDSGDEDDPWGDLGDEDDGRGEEMLAFRYNTGTSATYQAAMQNVVNLWNTQYATANGFKVAGAASSSSNYGTALTAATVPDVVEIADTDSQAVLSSKLNNGQSVLLPLDTTENNGVDLTNVGGTDLTAKYDKISLERFSSGTKNVNGVIKYSPLAENANLYGITSYINASVLIYNEDLFEAMGIQIISMDEDEAIAAGYGPFGYHVYDTNLNGKITVDSSKYVEINQIAAVNNKVSTAEVEGYRVFNNKIPMSWEEYIALASVFTKVYNDKQQHANMKHGITAEYWFNLGWSVGGDAMYSKNDTLYFGLDDNNPSYVVTNNVTIDGKNWVKGEILDYAARAAVAANKNAYISNLHEISNIVDAVSFFVAMSNNKDVKVGYSDAEAAAAQAKGLEQMAGYGVGYATGNGNSQSYEANFTTQCSAMCIRGYAAMRDHLKSYDFWNIAPLPQYKQYTANADGSGDEVKTNVTTTAKAVKKVNVVEIKGYLSTWSSDFAFAIPRNAKHTEWAKTFLKWLLTDNVQNMLIDGSGITPIVSLRNNATYLQKFQESYDMADFNIDALVNASYYGTAADWCYTSAGNAWVNIWSNPFNNELRIGKLSIYNFYYGTTANTAVYEGDTRANKTWSQMVNEYLVDQTVAVPVMEYEIISHKTFQNLPNA